MHPSLSHLFCSEFLHSPSSNRRDQSQIEMQKVGGCKIRVRMKKGSNEWVRVMLGSKFFEMCVDHEELKKNEKNLFCVDCNLCFCKHCVFSSAYDCRLLQICRYVYHDVVRLNDIHPFLDCSLIQSYKINGEKAVHLNPRPQLKDAKSSKTKGGGTCCEACGRHIQDLPNRFCCIACKVSMDAEMSMKSVISRNAGSLESELENSCEIGYASSPSSEVIQTLSSREESLRPNKIVRKRKISSPRRAPLF